MLEALTRSFSAFQLSLLHYLTVLQGSYGTHRFKITVLVKKTLRQGPVNIPAQQYSLDIETDFAYKISRCSEYDSSVGQNKNREVDT